MADVNKLPKLGPPYLAPPSPEIADSSVDELWEALGEAFSVPDNQKQKEEEAAEVEAVNQFTLKKLQEPSFFKKLMPPVMITNEELDAVVEEDPPVKSGFLDSPNGPEECVLEVFDPLKMDEEAKQKFKQYLDAQEEQDKAGVLLVGKHYPVMNTEGSTLGWANLPVVEPADGMAELLEKVNKLPKQKQAEFHYKVQEFMQKSTSMEHINSYFQKWLDAQKVPTPAKSEGTTHYYPSGKSYHYPVGKPKKTDTKMTSFYNEQLGVPYELKSDDILLDPIGGKNVSNMTDQQKLNKTLVDSFPTKFPKLLPMGGKNFKEKEARPDSVTPDEVLPKEGGERLYKVTIREDGSSEYEEMGNQSIDVREIEKQCGGKATALPPQDYEADLVFEAVRSVVGQMLDKNQDLMFKKVSDVLAETIVEERKDWQNKIQDVKRITSKEATELRNQMLEMQKAVFDMKKRCDELADQLETSSKEVVKLRTENRQLRVSGGLARSPRKVKVDNAPSDK